MGPAPNELFSEIGNKDLSLEKALEHFQEIYMSSRNFTERTREGYAGDIAQLVEFLRKAGVTRTRQVALPHLQTYIAELEKRGLSDTTRYRKTIAIKTFFWFLQEYEVAITDPARRLIPPKRAEKQIRYLLEPEYKALMRACSHQPRDAAIVELFLQTGIRLSELAQLTVDDVHLPERINRDNLGSILVKGKGRKERTVTINHRACRALKNWLKVRPELNHPALFVTMFKEPMGVRSIQNSIKKYLAEAGIQNASVHTLRHTYATWAKLHGAELSALQKRLGHSDIRSTMRYIHTSDELQKKLAQIEL